MASPVDLELKKAFAQLQVKMVETRKKINAIDVEIEEMEKILKIVESTREDLFALSNDTIAYKPVSRMFLQTDFGEIKEEMNDRVSLIHRRIAYLEDKKEYLDAKLNESNHNLREMVRQRKDQI